MSGREKFGHSSLGEMRRTTNPIPMVLLLMVRYACQYISFHSQFQYSFLYDTDGIRARHFIIFRLSRLVKQKHGTLAFRVIHGQIVPTLISFLIWRLLPHSLHWFCFLINELPLFFAQDVILLVLQDRFTNAVKWKAGLESCQEEDHVERNTNETYF